jgi:hypothetical protein
VVFSAVGTSILHCVCIGGIEIEITGGGRTGAGTDRQHSDAVLARVVGVSAETLMRRCWRVRLLMEGCESVRPEWCASVRPQVVVVVGLHVLPTCAHGMRREDDVNTHTRHRRQQSDA